MKQVIYYLLSISFVLLTFYIAFYAHFNETLTSICVRIHLLLFGLGYSGGYTFYTVEMFS
jgi:hypothetical protein